MIASSVESRDAIIDALQKVAENGIPSPESTAMLDVGTRAYLQYIEGEVVDDLLGHGGATFKVYEGSYGAGKTHLLQLLSGLGLERGMAVAQTNLSRSMGLEEWQAVTSYILGRIQLLVDGQRFRSLPGILGALRGSVDEPAKTLRNAPLPHAGFKEAMWQMTAGPLAGAESSEILARYLQGERVLVRDLRGAGFMQVKDPLSKRNAESVLATALSGLRLLGIPGTMLLFDENEELLADASSKKTRAAANLMRRMIDACATGGLPGTLTVFTVLPGFLEHCSQDYPALGQRLQRPRGGDIKPSWRWPVLSIEHVNSITNQDEFLASIIKVFHRLADACGVTDGVLGGDLHQHGQQALAGQAGSGYRRQLMKVLASVTLQAIEVNE